MSRGTPAKKILRYLGISVLFAIILIYGILSGKDLIFGINLNINGIKDNETIRQSVLGLSGSAKHSLGITINQRPVSVTEDGAWQDTVALLPGINTIRISAEDKFGRTIEKTFTVNYSPPS